MKNESEERFEVFWDGQCTLCQREIEMLRNRDRNQSIRFTDFTEDPGLPNKINVSYGELMAKIHGRLADGTIISGVEVFRQLYHRAGFRRSVWISRTQPIAFSLDMAYNVFARWRLNRHRQRCYLGGCQINDDSTHGTTGVGK